MNIDRPTILILHPGEMGAAIGARLRERDLTVNWVAHGRSENTQARADQAGLISFDTLEAALQQSDLTISVCPPQNALSLASDVASTGYNGLFVDANAVAPKTSAQVSDIITRSGGRFVDGGIIGPPPVGSAKTRFYLSGPDASCLAPILSHGPLTSIALSDQPGAASALKMCFSGWNKARIGLLTNLYALACHHGVEQSMLAEFEQRDPDVMRFFDTATPGGTVMATARKAWRWSPEMLEIAATFDAAGLPADYHKGAADVFARLASFKDSDAIPSFDELAKAMSND